MKLLKTINILALAALAVLMIPALVPTIPTTPIKTTMVSYNPPPADVFHAPISSMGLIGYARLQSNQLSLSTSTVSSSSSGNVQNGPRTIRQNAVRFINDNSYFPQTETSVAVDPGNTSRVLGGFNDLKFFFCPVLPADCGSSIPSSVSGFTVSTDGGASVLKSSDVPGLFIPAAYLNLVSLGDPTVVADANHNFFYGSLAFNLVYGSNGIMIAKSNPNLFDPKVSCITSLDNLMRNDCWTAVFVDGTLQYFPNTVEDKPMIAVDNSQSPYSGSVYVGWNHLSLLGGFSYLARCDNALSSCVMLGGENLPPISGPDPFADFTTPVVDAKGNVYVSWCNYGTQTTLGPITCKVRSSPPGGLNFGVTTTIFSFMGTGTTLPSASYVQGFATEQFRTASLPFMAVDTSPTSTQGNLYFTIQVCTSGRYIAPFAPLLTDNPGDCGFSAILVSTSTNAGLTWSSPITVSDPAVNAQPTITVDTVTGRVYVLYYTTKYDPFNHRIDVVASTSNDGGSSFHTFRVTSVSNEPDSDPNMFFYGNPFGGSWTVPQYGDYFQGVAIKGTLWVLFTANYAVEVGTFQTDPFLAVVTSK